MPAIVTSSSSAIPWSTVFANDRPVEVEIGPGRGEVLLASAAAAPAINYFAIERRAGAAAALARRVAAHALGNVRVLAGDARFVIAHLVPDASITAYHIYFPEPWPKTRHRRRRLVTADMALHLARTLVPGGVLHLATDLPDLLEAFAKPLVGAGFVRLPGATTSESRPITTYERRYAHGGTHAACFVRRP